MSSRPIENDESSLPPPLLPANDEVAQHSATLRRSPIATIDMAGAPSPPVNSYAGGVGAPTPAPPAHTHVTNPDGASFPPPTQSLQQPAPLQTSHYPYKYEDDEEDLRQQMLDQQFYYYEGDEGPDGENGEGGGLWQQEEHQPQDGGGGLEAGYPHHYHQPHHYHDHYEHHHHHHHSHHSHAFHQHGHQLYDPTSQYDPYQNGHHYFGHHNSHSQHHFPHHHSHHHQQQQEPVAAGALAGAGTGVGGEAGPSPTQHHHGDAQHHHHAHYHDNAVYYYQHETHPFTDDGADGGPHEDEEAFLWAMQQQQLQQQRQEQQRQFHPPDYYFGHDHAAPYHDDFDAHGSQAPMIVPPSSSSNGQASEGSFYFAAMTGSGGGGSGSGQQGRDGGGAAGAGGGEYHSVHAHVVPSSTSAPVPRHTPPLQTPTEETYYGTYYAVHPTSSTSSTPLPQPQPQPQPYQQGVGVRVIAAAAEGDRRYNATTSSSSAPPPPALSSQPEHVSGAGIAATGARAKNGGDVTAMEGRLANGTHHEHHHEHHHHQCSPHLCPQPGPFAARSDGGPQLPPLSSPTTSSFNQQHQQPHQHDYYSQQQPIRQQQPLVLPMDYVIPLHAPQQDGEEGKGGAATAADPKGGALPDAAAGCNTAKAMTTATVGNNDGQQEQQDQPPQPLPVVAAPAPVSRVRKLVRFLTGERSGSATTGGADLPRRDPSAGKTRLYTHGAPPPPSAAKTESDASSGSDTRNMDVRQLNERTEKAMEEQRLRRKERRRQQRTAASKAPHPEKSGAKAIPTNNPAQKERDGASSSHRSTSAAQSLRTSKAPGKADAVDDFWMSSRLFPLFPGRFFPWWYRDAPMEHFFMHFYYCGEGRSFFFILATLLWALSFATKIHITVASAQPISIVSIGTALVAIAMEAGLNWYTFSRSTKDGDEREGAAAAVDEGTSPLPTTITGRPPPPSGSGGDKTPAPSAVGTRPQSGRTGSLRARTPHRDRSVGDRSMGMDDDDGGIGIDFAALQDLHTAAVTGSGNFPHAPATPNNWEHTATGNDYEMRPHEPFAWVGEEGVSSGAHEPFGDASIDAQAQAQAWPESPTTVALGPARNHSHHKGATTSPPSPPSRWCLAWRRWWFGAEGSQPAADPDRLSPSAVAPGVEGSIRHRTGVWGVIRCLVGLPPRSLHPRHRIGHDAVIEAASLLTRTAGPLQGSDRSMLGIASLGAASSLSGVGWRRGLSGTANSHGGTATGPLMLDAGRAHVHAIPGVAARPTHILPWAVILLYELAAFLSINSLSMIYAAEVTYLFECETNPSLYFIPFAHHQAVTPQDAIAYCHWSMSVYMLAPVTLCLLIGRPKVTFSCLLFLVGAILSGSYTIAKGYTETDMPADMYVASQVLVVALVTAVSIFVFRPFLEAVERRAFEDAVLQQLRMWRVQHEKQALKEYVDRMMPMRVRSRLIHRKALAMAQRPFGDGAPFDPMAIFATMDHTPVGTIVAIAVYNFGHYCGQRTPVQIALGITVLHQQLRIAATKCRIDHTVTLGDTFVGVTNLLSRQPQHAVIGVRLVYEVSGLQQTNPETPQLRIAVHSGPITGAVTGSAMLTYAVYGPTYWVATQHLIGMCGLGDNFVMVSETTVQELGDRAQAHDDHPLAMELDPDFMPPLQLLQPRDEGDGYGGLPAIPNTMYVYTCIELFLTEDLEDEVEDAHGLLSDYNSTMGDDSVGMGSIFDGVGGSAGDGGGGGGLEDGDDENELLWLLGRQSVDPKTVAAASLSSLTHNRAAFFDLRVSWFVGWRNVFSHPDTERGFLLYQSLYASLRPRIVANLFALTMLVFFILVTFFEPGGALATFRGDAGPFERTGPCSRGELADCSLFIPHRAARKAASLAFFGLALLFSSLSLAFALYVRGSLAACIGRLWTTLDPDGTQRDAAAGTGFEGAAADRGEGDGDTRLHEDAPLAYKLLILPEASIVTPFLQACRVVDRFISPYVVGIATIFGATLSRSGIIGNNVTLVFDSVILFLIFSSLPRRAAVGTFSGAILVLMGALGATGSPIRMSIAVGHACSVAVAMLIATGLERHERTAFRRIQLLKIFSDACRAHGRVRRAVLAATVPAPLLREFDALRRSLPAANMLRGEAAIGTITVQDMVSAQVRVDSLWHMIRHGGEHDVDAATLLHAGYTRIEEALGEATRRTQAVIRRKAEADAEFQRLHPDAPLTPLARYRAARSSRATFGGGRGGPPRDSWLAIVRRIGDQVTIAGPLAADEPHGQREEVVLCLVYFLLLLSAPRRRPRKGVVPVVNAFAGGLLLEDVPVVLSAAATVDFGITVMHSSLYPSIDVIGGPCRSRMILGATPEGAFAVTEAVSRIFRNSHLSAVAYAIAAEQRAARRTAAMSSSTSTTGNAPRAQAPAASAVATTSSFALPALGPSMDAPPATREEERHRQRAHAAEGSGSDVVANSSTVGTGTSSPLLDGHRGSRNQSHNQSTNTHNHHGLRLQITAPALAPLAALAIGARDYDDDLFGRARRWRICGVGSVMVHTLRKARRRPLVPHATETSPHMQPQAQRSPNPAAGKGQLPPGGAKQSAKQSGEGYCDGLDDLSSSADQDAAWEWHRLL